MNRCPTPGRGVGAITRQRWHGFCRMALSRGGLSTRAWPGLTPGPWCMSGCTLEWTGCAGGGALADVGRGEPVPVFVARSASRWHVSARVSHIKLQGAMSARANHTKVPTGDEPYPRHWSQRLGLLRSRPDPVGRASMRGGPSPSIVGDACKSAQRNCRSCAAKRRPNASISSSLSPASTTPASVAATPCARATSRVCCAWSARTNNANPAPMFSVL